MIRDTITVIIPVYNGKAFLPRCLESVRRQTYGDLEILLVDDGSTDGSADLCDAYEKEDARIRVIHQANGGLSAARNAGLEAGSGDLILFLDCDDAIQPVMIEGLWRILQETGADIAQCGFQEIREGEAPEIVPLETLGDADLTAIQVDSGDQVVARIFSADVSWVVQWNKLYRRRIFDKIRFPEGKYHEDEFVAHQELLAADRVAWTQEKWHLYYRHGASITGTPTMEKRYHAAQAMALRTQFFEARGRSDLSVRSYHSLKEIVFDAGCRRKEFPDSRAWWPAMVQLAAETDDRHRAYQRKLPLSVKLWQIRPWAGRMLWEIKVKMRSIRKR